MANKRGWWSLDIRNVDDDNYIDLSECDIDHIARCIKDGCTQGEIVIDDEE